MHAHPFIRPMLLALGLAGLAGCATVPAERPPADAAASAGVVAEKYQPLDRPVREAVECFALHERVLPDGRLEVVAVMRNLTAAPVKLQLNCVFKDAQGFSIGDETPFQSATVFPGVNESVRFTSAGATARSFTVRARLAR
ncbi:MAG: hypothetical protein KIT44_08370 [Opitutaceae bacterium]|nr:hypothetical protein [Opitutaceae bacterium]